MDYKKLFGMGYQVKNTLPVPDCFKNINFDEVYVCEGGNEVAIEGEKTIGLFFRDEQSSSYRITIGKSANVRLYSWFSDSSKSDVSIFCAENSVCDALMVQLESSSQKILVHQTANSIYQCGIFQLGGSANAINLTVEKRGEAANTDLYGLFFPHHKESYAIETLVKHESPLCETNELFRGIADGEGSGSFSGVVYVARDAQKTVAKQQNKNLLLSDAAHIHSEPQLEIYADDVVCNHGSSTGQIDKEALWYMQARGISKETATQLLVAGFANDVVAKISDEQVRNAIGDMIQAKIHNR